MADAARDAALAAAIPVDFAGNRVFIADPNASGLSALVGDMAAMNLQLLHTVRLTSPDAAHARLDAMAQAARRVLTASQAGQAREQSTKVLTPVTRLPAAPWGVEARVSQISNPVQDDGNRKRRPLFPSTPFPSFPKKNFHDGSRRNFPFKKVKTECIKTVKTDM